jgi:hypothetical protein
LAQLPLVTSYAVQIRKPKSIWQRLKDWLLRRSPAL